MDDVKINVLAYADDVVLLAKSRRDRKDLLRMASKFFERRGMKLNGPKCAVLVVKNVGKQKKLYASTRARFYIAGQQITTCGWDGFKYFGYKIGAMGVSPADIASLPAMLRRIKRSPLKPSQKLVIIKQYLIP